MDLRKYNPIKFKHDKFSICVLEEKKIVETKFRYFKMRQGLKIFELVEGFQTSPLLRYFR